MKKFLLIMRSELFNKIKLYADTHRKSITATLINFIEIGYLESIKYETANYRGRDDYYYDE